MSVLLYVLAGIGAAATFLWLFTFTVWAGLRLERRLQARRMVAEIERQLAGRQ